MIFCERNCNFPSRTYGQWWLSQFRRWGIMKGAPNYSQVAESVLPPDICLEAMKELGSVDEMAASLD